jgi:hypothetical protein
MLSSANFGLACTSPKPVITCRNVLNSARESRRRRHSDTVLAMRALARTFIAKGRLDDDLRVREQVQPMHIAHFGEPNPQQP